MGSPQFRRAVYYASRLISAQNGMEFKNADYDKLRKVYSIWICINGEKSLHNTVTEYCFHEKNMLGCYKGNREKYDLIDIIFIGLGNFEDKNDETIVGFLDNILDRDLEPLERKQILKDKFDITTSDDLMEVFGDMCNLSDGVYLDGVRKGEARGAENKQLEMLRQFMANNHAFDEFIQMFNITNKEEIDFLKENIQIQ